jgi:hypothetical protein
MNAFCWESQKGRRTGHRWDDTIEMDLKEIVCGGMEMDSSGSGQRQMEGSCEHVN